MFSNKSQLQGISRSPNQQQHSYPREFTRRLSYFSKNIPLIGKIASIGLLVSVIRESICSNIITPMRSTQQGIAVDYPFRFVKNASIEIFFKLLLDCNQFHRENSKVNPVVSHGSNGENNWFTNFNWDNPWDPEWDLNNGGMHRRFSGDMTWASFSDDSDNSDNTHNNEEEENDTEDNCWELYVRSEDLLDENNQLKIFPNPGECLGSLAGKDNLHRVVWGLDMKRAGEWASQLSTNQLIQADLGSSDLDQSIPSERINYQLQLPKVPEGSWPLQ